MNEIEEFFNKKDISLYGFSPIRELSSVSDDFSPKKLLKEAQTVIIFAIPIPKGVLYSDSHDQLLFWRYSNVMYRNLDIIASSLCIVLEEKGFKSTPIYGCFPWKVVDREFWGLLSLVYWAEQAGLGKITKCGLLANPKYGTRILFGGVITSKPFNSSEIITEEICPKDCYKCTEVCPVNAIDPTGKVSHDKCMQTAHNNPLMAYLMKDSEFRKSFDFEAIINTIGVDDHSTYSCLECLKACPLNQL